MWTCNYRFCTIIVFMYKRHERKVHGVFKEHGLMIGMGKEHLHWVSDGVDIFVLWAGRKILSEYFSRYHVAHSISF